METAKILIVDDEAVIRTALAMNIALDFNCTVLEAANGEEGLEMFQSCHPDLIITDLTMPVMNGLRLIERIRAADAKVKIIVLSAQMVSESSCQTLQAAGADHCLCKPIRQAKLSSLIAQLLPNAA